MKTIAFKRSIVTALAFATIATTATFSTTQSANAGRKDFWAGAAAGVVTGVIVGGAVRSRRHHVRRVSAWEAHVDWCYDHRPRYRQSDNTYRRSGQRRRTCYSPYYD